MSLRRRDPGHGVLGDGVRHYLETGCWGGWGGSISGDEKWEIFAVSSNVLRGRFDRLRSLWHDVALVVKASHPSETYAEKVLRLRAGAGLEAARLSERLSCSEHPVVPLERRNQ